MAKINAFYKWQSLIVQIIANTANLQVFQFLKEASIKTGILNRQCF